MGGVLGEIMESGKRTRFVIVGGGTAGWIAAMMLQRHSKDNGLPIDITVVESSKIPTIGVGEGTTAVFRQILYELKIDEVQFVRETEATVKFGIRHKDWKKKGHFYDGPIDDPHLLNPSREFSPQEQASALDIYAVSAGKSVADIRLFGKLMRLGKSPYAIEKDGTLTPSGPFQHAFHFDQAKVGAWLRTQAEGITHVDAEVVGARQNNETGDIEALTIAEGGEVEGDFFFDCTGFRRKLIGEVMGAKWVSYKDVLPVNRAMPFWIEHKEGQNIAPLTLAWAQEAGWMWSIPTQDRIGCGYVYSDEYVSPDEAKAQIEKALGHEIEPRNDIKIDGGCLDRAWIGNCLALGLSSSFLEPLEATSIHGTIVQLMLFRQFFIDKAATAGDEDRERYNNAAAGQLNDFCSFINIHYTGERQEPFWQFVRNECLHDHTKKRLDHWSKTMPRRDDFVPFPGDLPHINEQLYYPVLDGLGHLDRKIARDRMASNPKLRSYAKKTAEAYAKQFSVVASKCASHIDYLEAVKSGRAQFSWG